jgi:hypothetical protein
MKYLIYFIICKLFKWINLYNCFSALTDDIEFEMKSRSEKALNGDDDWEWFYPQFYFYYKWYLFLKTY